MCGFWWTDETRRTAREPVQDRSTTSMPPTQPAHVRVSDTEREHVATRLREAAGRGELSLDEAGERQAAAYAAKTRGDLAPLTSDLPPPPAPPPPTRTSAARVRDYLADIHPALLLTAVVAVIVTAGVVAVDLAGGHAGFPWFLLWIPVFVGLRHRHHHRRRYDGDRRTLV